MKWLWSLKTTSKKTGFQNHSLIKVLIFFFFYQITELFFFILNQSAVSTKSMVKFENGYTVETVLDGSKLGIDPYSLHVLPNGELLILDSENSNVYKISSSLSLCKFPPS